MSAATETPIPVQMSLEGQTPDGTSFQRYGAGDGNGDAPSLILIHGLGLSRHTWDQYIAGLAQHYDVITYDLFGHGNSAMPPRKPDLTLFSEQVISLMDHLGVADAVMIGFSLGGMINRRIALDHQARVKGLVILNSPHERRDNEQKKVEARAIMTRDEGIQSTIETTLARWFTPGFIKSNPDAVDQVRQGVLANDLEAYAACRFVLANGVVELIRPKTTITAPKLVMTAEHDSGSTPEMSHAIAGEIEGAETIIIPALQHMGLVEQPELFLSPINRFLENLHQREIRGRDD